MPKITNLFREKVYIFGQQPEVFESEKQLINSIFWEQVLENPSEIKFVDANVDNDLFLVKNKDGNFFVKLTLDSEKSNLENEFKILDLNIEHLITPFPIANGFSDFINDIEYSIISEIPAPNLSDFGIFNLLNNPEAVNNFFNKLSLFKAPSGLRSFNQYCQHYLSFDIFKLPNIEISWIENHEKIKKIAQEQVVYLQKILKEKLKNFNMPKVHVCHGNLNTSTILVLGDYVHAVNWENAYHGDLYFELCNLKYELFFDDSVEKEMIANFAETTTHKISNDRLKEYALFAKYFQLLKIIVDYLYETYVLEAKRQNKIINCAIKLSKNYETFYQLPDFDKNLKPIAEFFTESVI